MSDLPSRPCGVRSADGSRALTVGALWIRSAERISQLMPSKTYLQKATDRDIMSRKIRLDSYLKTAFADPDLSAQAKRKGSNFYKFLCHQPTDMMKGGICYRSILRVRTGQGTPMAQSPLSAHRLRETLLDLLAVRRIPSISGRGPYASRAELERLSDRDLREKSKEAGITEDEWSSARRFLWLDSRGDMATLAFTHVEDGETEEDVWSMVDDRMRMPIRSVVLGESRLNPDASLREKSSIEVVSDEVTVVLYAGSDSNWVHWMALLAPLVDKERMARYYETHRLHGQPKLDAKEVLANHSRIATSKEFADFTYGRVKRSYTEQDPERLARIKAGMGVLADDVDSTLARFTDTDNPESHSAELGHTSSMTPSSVAQYLGDEGTLGENRPFTAVGNPSDYSVRTGGDQGCCSQSNRKESCARR